MWLGAALIVVLNPSFATSAPIPKVTPLSIHFPKTIFGVVGDQSKDVRVHLSNPKSAPPISGLTFAFSGANPGDFKQTSAICGSTLAAGARCLVTLAFVPTVLGERSATFASGDDANPAAGAVSLSGTGIPRKLTIKPRSISGCLGDLPGLGAHCTVSVTFSPTSTGTKRTTLMIDGDQAKSPSMVELSGTGSGSPAGATPTPTATPTHTPEGATPTPTATPTQQGTTPTIGKSLGRRSVQRPRARVPAAVYDRYER
jgi:hypothetical protein